MTCDWVLLADSEVYRSHGGVSQYLLLLAAVAAVVLAIVGFYLWNTWKRTRGHQRDEASPEDVLAELYKAHDLSRTEQSLISVLAQKDRLTQPALLFIDPDPFDRASEGADPDAVRYRALRQKLFGTID